MSTSLVIVPNSRAKLEGVGNYNSVVPEMKLTIAYRSHIDIVLKYKL